MPVSLEADNLRLGAERERDASTSGYSCMGTEKARRGEKWEGKKINILATKTLIFQQLILPRRQRISGRHKQDPRIRAFNSHESHSDITACVKPAG